MSTKGLLITTGNLMVRRDFGPDVLHGLQKAVGGYIEHVLPCGLIRPLCMIVNEEGALNRLPINEFGSALYQGPIHGDIVLMKDGINSEGEMDILGLSDEELDFIVDQVFAVSCGHVEEVIE